MIYQSIYTKKSYQKSIKFDETVVLFYQSIYTLLEKSERFRKITRTAVRFPRTCGPGKSPGRSGTNNFSLVRVESSSINSY